MNEFARALDVANAVLYEGYLLYPYTASSMKNRLRWQFGVVVPRSSPGAHASDASTQQTDVLIDSEGDPRVHVRLRFLHVESRRVEAGAAEPFVPVDSLGVDAQTYLTFDEAAEEQVDAELRPSHEPQRVVPISFEASTSVEIVRDAAGDVRGRIVRERWPLRGSMLLAAEAVSASLTRLRVRVQNRSTVVDGATRDAVVRTAFVSTHVLLRVENGRFLSALDPPEFATGATSALDNQHVWPVLIGDRARDDHGASLVLSSPIILYDFPEVGAGTEADAFDATEIDELLRLSVLSLSDAERAEARATDPRASAIVERAERFGREKLAQLHGELQPVGRTATDIDPFTAIDVPSIDCVFIDGVKVAKGSSVRLHPKRRADAWDMFLAGRVATVCAIHQDLEDLFYVAVTVDDDPASDLHEWYGRSFFFYPDEVEPLSSPAVAP